MVETMPALRWSEKTPAESGDYWWRAHRRMEGKLVRVEYDTDGQLMCALPGHPWERIELCRGEWAGPISQPVEACDARL